MTNKLFLLLLQFLLCALLPAAQTATTSRPRPLTLTEYEKAKTFQLNDLDKDTYAKFENLYILDRYEMRKPYFITGDDSLKKRIDLYKLYGKEGMQELGTVIFYTNEKGKRYTAVQPNFTAGRDVWNRYFNEIDSINKEEKNFVLKLSYILSREMSFQLYKAINSGRDLKEEAGTYGTDICFPGDQEVSMADGTSKKIRDVRPGEMVLTVDPVSKTTTATAVTQLVHHGVKNYAITNLLVVRATSSDSPQATEVHLSAKLLSATPNHPLTMDGRKQPIGAAAIGDIVTCYDQYSKKFESYTVINKTENAGGNQEVFNLVMNAGTTVILSEVVVLQK